MSVTEYELHDKLTADIDALKRTVEYKLEKMSPAERASAEMKYLRTLRTELAIVKLKLELEHLEYREQHILEHINEEDLELWEELERARAKAEELEERVQESIEDDVKDLIYELDEIREKQEMLEAFLKEEGLL